MTKFGYALLLTLLAAGCRSTPGSAPAPSANAWAVVDGREISRDEVEKAYRRAAPVGTQPSDEEAMTAKLNLLNELIVQDLLIAKANTLKVVLPDAELDKAFNDAKANIPNEAFEKELKSRNLTAADMRDDLRRNLLAQKVIDQEVTAKVAVTDQDIKAFYEANRAQFNRAEDAVRIAQIVITPGRENQQLNRTGDDAGTPQEAQAKVQMLMQRLKEGATFGDLAADYSEDGESAQRGGDLGFVPMTALLKAPAQLRDAVLKSAPGTVQVVSQGGAHTVVLIVAKETAGQKDPSMPEVKEAISNTLKGRKEQLLRAAFLSNLRNDAVVVNALAKQLVASQGKPPSLAPAAPGAK